MKDKTTVTIIGGDRRQGFLAEQLMERGLKINTYGVPRYESENLIEIMEAASYVICPVPVTKDQIWINMQEDGRISIEELKRLLHGGQYLLGGSIPAELSEYCGRKGIGVFDFMKSDEIALMNAVATAEGALSWAVNESEGNLHGSQALVLGYGRCAAVLARKLQGLDVCVTIGARKQSAVMRAYVNGHQGILLKELAANIGEYDYIFNTAPALILTEDMLMLTKQDVTIIDIASAPGGVDFEAAGTLGRKAGIYPGIPGKTAAKASGRILGDAIFDIIKERRGAE